MNIASIVLAVTVFMLMKDDESDGTGAVEVFLTSVCYSGLHPHR